MLNRYKNMVVLSDQDPEKLVEQLKAIPYEFSIVSMYGLGGRHYAYISVDRPVKLVKKRKVRKQKSIEELQNELNLKE
jgi:uncharacterized protein (DUF2249 family)